MVTLFSSGADIIHTCEIQGSLWEVLVLGTLAYNQVFFTLG